MPGLTLDGARRGCHIGSCEWNGHAIRPWLWNRCGIPAVLVKELTSAINQYLAAEFQAGHTYLAMSIWLREKDLDGFSTYRHDQSQEERDHAARMIAYMVDSDEQVELPTIQAPERSWPSVQTLLDQAYDMEKGVTASINRLYAVAEARFVRKRLRLVGDNRGA